MKHIVLLPPIAIMSMGCVSFDEITPWLDNYNEPRSSKIAVEARTFIIKRQGCDHFRGEYGGDDTERQKFIKDQVAKLCKGTDAELQHLRAKYASQPETMNALADFEDCIEFDSVCSEKD